MGESSMGTEIQHKAVVEHSELGRLTWTLREYPIGVEDDRETDVGEHTLLDDVRYGLRHEAD